LYNLIYKSQYKTKTTVRKLLAVVFVFGNADFICCYEITAASGENKEQDKGTA
jgi:hypothetical protein